MTPNSRTKNVSSCSSTFSRAYGATRLTPNTTRRTKATISTNCAVRTDTEKPRWYVETHTAKTTNDRVSDMTVAPEVTVTGSKRFAPSSVTIGSPTKVCDASKDPNTIAG